MAGMQRRLRYQANPSLHAIKTAESVQLLDESADRKFVVIVPGDPARPSNLPFWLEHGTVYMRARPFQKPTEMEEEPQHQRDMQTAADAVARGALT